MASIGGCHSCNETKKSGVRCLTHTAARPRLSEQVVSVGVIYGDKSVFARDTFVLRTCSGDGTHTVFGVIFTEQLSNKGWGYCGSFSHASVTGLASGWFLSPSKKLNPVVAPSDRFCQRCLTSAHLVPGHNLPLSKRSHKTYHSLTAIQKPFFVVCDNSWSCSSCTKLLAFVKKGTNIAMQWIIFHSCRIYTQMPFWKLGF